MEYFYTPPHLISQRELSIEGEEFEHLTHVMRKKVGEAIRVVDGSGHAFDVTIEDISKRVARCTINARHERLHEPALSVTLGVALLKNPARFDVLVEKATEIGVTAIVPLHTARTIPEHAKTARWQKLALAAMKQSGRCVLPKVHEPVDLGAFLQQPGMERLRIIPHEKETATTITSLLPSHTFTSAVICIGPEGGFSDEEIERAAKGGFIPVTLGPRRLRTETAAIAACAAILIR